MIGAFRIVTVANIPVQIHWTFGLLVAWIGYSGWTEGADTETLLWLYALVFSLFLCVVLHEFGHAMAARRYGIGTHDITLSPIGGVARLDSIPEQPRHEFVVAIAGPAVNVAIALLLGLIFGVGLLFQKANVMDVIREMSQGSDFLIREYVWLAFVLQLMVANVMLVLFNLIPAFPMDGGRIFRALLSTRIGRLRATLIATRLGQVLAVAFFVMGIWKEQYVTSLIGIFVFYTAAYEYKAVKMQHEYQLRSSQQSATADTDEITFEI